MRRPEHGISSRKFTPAPFFISIHQQEQERPRQGERVGKEAVCLMQDSKMHSNTQWFETFKLQFDSFHLFSIREDEVREACEPECNHHYTYQVSMCVYAGDEPIADIYHIQDKNEIVKIADKALKDAHFAIKIPRYLFFCDFEKWKGISLFDTKPNQSLLSKYTNTYKKEKMDFSYLGDMDFSLNAEELMWDTSVNNVIGLIKKCYTNEQFIREMAESFSNTTMEWGTSYIQKEIQQRLSLFCENIQNIDAPFVTDLTKCWLKEDVEDMFFMALLGKPENSRFTRFMSLESLAAMLSNRSQRMRSIVTMNDKAECFYAMKYVDENIEDDNENTKRIAEATDFYFNNYITSFSTCDETDLNMWRLYGNNCKGACVVYELEHQILSDEFHMAPVSYARNGKNECLELIKMILSGRMELCHRKFTLKRWGIWQRFFKSEQYAIEKEIRLLYSPKIIPNSKQWELTTDKVFSPYVDFQLIENQGYPLKIKKVFLGPNSPESATNSILIKALLDDMEYDCEVDIIKDLYYRNY